MRLFIGIALHPAVGERLATAARKLLPRTASDGGRIRWTCPGNMHVTLSFLGQVEPERLSQIQQSLAALFSPRLDLELSGASVFSNAGILLARVKPAAALLTLSGEIVLAMEACGFPREQRPYIPHVTLARAKGRIRLPPSGGDDPAFWQAFQASEFRLYESFTRPDGAHYQTLKAFPLG